MGDNWRYNQPQQETWREEQGSSMNDSWRSETVPNPPQNPELRLAVERLAEFVAKNGPQFEQMTREKQRNNPKFAFLFGGPHNDYYRYCVQMNIHGIMPGKEPEIVAELSQEEQQTVDKLKAQVQEYTNNIQQSEQNLIAHKSAIPIMKENQLKAHVADCESKKIEEHFHSVNFDISELEQHLSAMSSTKCSKETVSVCKKWIFDHCQTDQLREMILNYLLSRVKNEAATENFRLHVLYLINDWAYYCQRKKLHNQTQMLSRYVPQLYAFNVELARDGGMHQKLEKIVGVWEGGKYFSDQCFKQLRNPAQIVSRARAVEQGDYMKAGETIEQTLQAAYDGYEMQHNSYSAHCQQQIIQMEEEIRAIYNKSTQQSMSHPPPLMDLAPPPIAGRRSKFDQRSKGTISFDFLSGPRHSAEVAFSNRQSEEESWRPKQIIDGDDIDGTPFNENDLRPTKSYIELPAGVIVSLVPVETFTYEPIDPKKIELPPNLPPSQKLLAASSEFYKALEMDAQEMMEGVAADDWDLVKFPSTFLDKKAALKQEWMTKLIERGKTMEQVISNKPTKSDLALEDKERERFEEEERELIKKEVEAYYETQDVPIPEKFRQDSPEKRETRSRSSSKDSRGSPSERRSRRRSRSSSSSSNSTATGSDSDSGSSSSSDSSRSRERSISRSPTRVPFKRSPSPVERFTPSFATPAMPLGANNKGAQLMQKMGWAGKGLGAKESGIANPVDGGEVRDRMDQFKGLGKTEDPYESYRKKRAGFFRDKGAQRASERGGHRD